MVNKKIIFYSVCFLGNLINASTMSEKKPDVILQNKKVELIEKPCWFKRTTFKEGSCYQFTVYEGGFWAGTAFEGAVLAIAAFAQTTTKFEGFKASVLRPIGNNFLLRWGTFLAGYHLLQLANKNYQLTQKNNELEKKCSEEKEVFDPYNPSDPNFGNRFKK